ncbi:DUF1972 domain-containing protein [Loktanella salsilacus]|uniref:DUF1972 domain-containing protein n=1 Tax=Loktanella salsilacus TaxID=195913 RepID=UPI0020B693A3|nr:DUF1972 domain-containing protein [Loktanella salsilacus]UTH46295.1 DUF1972 domain-containing protein [Loktanella salsilacus]
MKLAILGTVGIPGRYGGFETLAENLVRDHAASGSADELTVYCSRTAYPDAPNTYLSAKLRYSRLNANGVQSVLYDAVTLMDAVARRNDVLLLLGVSGAIVLPFIRLISRARIVTNVDGIEWQRKKWSGIASKFIRYSERLALRYSHVVIADNQGIADYLREEYEVDAEVIAYGGDNAVECADNAAVSGDLPADYAIALCRIEPENNVAMILEAFAKARRPLVFVGNWGNSAYGQELRARYKSHKELRLLDPIYDPKPLYSIRAGASAYVHGHSAGGTNPALVEMMHFGIPVYAFDCIFNRYTTEERAQYFGDAEALTRLITEEMPQQDKTFNGSAMREIARRRYTWDKISGHYFSVLRSEVKNSI